jgi:hypothetical protein
MWRRAGRYSDRPEYINTKFVPSWINFQLRHRLCTAINDLEYQILKKMDQLLYGSQGIGRQNPLATWICLWILLLAYKDQMLFTYVHNLHDLFCM